jgi:hypothetical protein
MQITTPTLPKFLHHVLVQHCWHMYIGVLWVFQVPCDRISDVIYVQELFRLLLICMFHQVPHFFLEKNTTGAGDAVIVLNLDFRELYLIFVLSYPIDIK